MSKLSDILNSINYTKDDVFDTVGEDDYIPFIVNRILSYHPDALMPAQMLNMYADLPKRMQYDFLRLTLNKRKRYCPLKKKEWSEHLDDVKMVFHCSNQKAEQILKILNDEQIAEIKEMVKGMKQGK